MGLGNIGTAIVKGILKHRFTAQIFAFDPRTVDLDHVQFCQSAAEVARNSDIFITALPNPAIVRAVMEEGKALQALSADSIWIEHTSTEPDEVVRLCRVAQKKGIRFLEAPLTGGLALLQQGIMTVLAGDDEKEGQLLKDMERLLSCYTSNRLLMGKVGKAAIVKIISNQLCAVHTVCSAEALAMAANSGVDPENFFDGIRASAGNSYVFETEVPLYFNGSFDVRNLFSSLSNICF